MADELGNGPLLDAINETRKRQLIVTTMFRHLTDAEKNELAELLLTSTTPEELS